MKKTACFLSALVVTSVLVTATSGDPVHITAVLGLSVTFRCPWDLSTPVKRLYFQKEEPTVFINGFSNDREITPVIPSYLNRTEVNKDELSMKMSNITVSDEGLYQCVIFDNSSGIKLTEIYLKVTAKYSVPTIEPHCSERAAGKSCQLSCSTVGGYPLNYVRWLGLNHSLQSDFHNETSEDSVTKTWSINHTLTYSCDRPTNVSCAVEDVVSRTITICETKSSPPTVIVAVVVLVIVLLVIVLIMVLKYCRRTQTPPSENEADAEVPLADCCSQLKSV